MGTYAWASRRVGLDLELDYNILNKDGRPAHEFFFAFGPVFRF